MWREHFIYNYINYGRLIALCTGLSHRSRITNNHIQTFTCISPYSVQRATNNRRHAQASRWSSRSLPYTHNAVKPWRIIGLCRRVVVGVATVPAGPSIVGRISAARCQHLHSAVYAAAAAACIIILIIKGSAFSYRLSAAQSAIPFVQTRKDQPKAIPLPYGFLLFIRYYYDYYYDHLCTQHAALPFWSFTLTTEVGRWDLFSVGSVNEGVVREYGIYCISDAFSAPLSGCTLGSQPNIMIITIINWGLLSPCMFLVVSQPETVEGRCEDGVLCDSVIFGRCIRFVVGIMMIVNS